MKWLEKFDKIKKIKIPDFGKKAISLLTAFALLTVSIPASEVVNGMSYLVGEIKAAAAEEPTYEIKADNTCYINTADDLVKFSKAYDNSPSTYQNVTISITTTEGAYNNVSDEFVSIGSENYPFSGKLTFGNNLDLSLYKPLFGYINNSVEISGNIILRRNKDATDITPLFANNVLHTTDSTKDWKITAEPYKVGTGEGAELYVKNFAGVIGTIGKNAQVKLTFTNNTVGNSTNADISNSGNVGLACQTMGENSLLDFTLDSTSKNTAYNVTATGGNAGGIVGTMESGANLTLNNSISSTGEVKSETDYAGGVVGYAKDATVNFGADTSVNATVNGSTATGGVFGKFENSVENKEFEVSKYSIDCTLNGKNNGGLFGELENSDSITVNGNVDSAGVCEIKSKRTVIGDNYGGLIGTYSSDSTSNTLEIKNINTLLQKDTSAGAKYYGGVIAKITDDSYVKISNVTASAQTCENNVENFGGLVAESSGAFIDATDVTINTNNSKFNGGGIVGNLNSGVLRLSGNTDLSKTGLSSGMSGYYGQIVKTRDNQALVYAKSDWNLIRSSNSKQYYDDIYSWGEVLRFNDNNLKEADILTEDTTNHTITVKPAVTDISTVTDFAKLALNIQMNNGETTNNTLKFENITESKSSNLLSQTISLNDNIDLSGTGITGLTRDDGANNAFTGTFNGNSHKISLAVGEPYGYRGSISDENKIPNTQYADTDATAGNGVIYRHQYIGLFAKTGGGAKFENLTIGGKIKVDDNSGGMSIGYLSGQHTDGTININNVTVSKDDNDEIYLNSNGSAYTGCGGFIGKVTSGGTINIDGCTISPKIKTKENSTTNGPFRIGGAIGEIVSTENAITVNVKNSTKIGAVITNNSKGATYNNPTYTGGFIGYIGDNGSANATCQINLNDLTIDGANITSGVSNSDISVGGGLLGQNWNNVQVNIGENNTKGITVTSGTVTYNGTGDFAGLVTVATGYWKVYNIDINGIAVVGSTAKSFGMLVNKGIWEDNSQRKALYLELENENAYKIEQSGATFNIGSATFDELVADCSDFTTESNNSKNYDNSDICSNGNAVVSIHTTDGTVTMNGTNCNTYQNQTGRDISNPNTRYYYNLDVIRKNPANDSEKLLLWSVYKYAHSSLSSYFPNPFGSDIIPKGEYDMKGLSYYPVDVTDGVTVDDGSTFTFYNSEIETGESVTGDTDSKARSTTVTTSQHFSMHFGLFKNMAGDIKITDVTFSGNCGHTSDPYSGVLTYTTISGTSSNPTTATINGITLNGIKINDVKGALLIDRIGSYSTVKISNVKTEKNSYNDSTTAAQYLIRRVGGSSNNNASNIIVKFSNIVLDSRISALSNTDVNNALTTAYGTEKSIFKDSTLIGTYQYPTGAACSAIYNYKHSEDWGTDGNTATHKVTYGKEVSDSGEYDGLQEKYINSEFYTSPEESNRTSEEYDFSKNFLPYVATAYDETQNYHEVKVNHTNKASLSQGCGTYNDPYIINSSDQLIFIASILYGDDPTTDDTVVNYIVDNYKNWCNEKTSHKVYSWQEDNFYETDEDGNINTSSSITVDEIRTALSTAYYQLGSDVTLPDSFIGLGRSTPFKGVIYGKDSNGVIHTITNGSTNPLIYNSTGSVVKDLTVNVTADFTSNFQSVTANTPYETDGSGTTPFYGGIFGIVNGGDNIIDNVSVTIEKASTISSKGTNPGNVAVGGYVGVVHYGGVIFRNMSGATKPDFTGNDKFCDVSGIKNNNVYLYFNPIIGRVIDGYAFTETDDTYTPSETAEPTMQNGTKNYSIADIDNTTTNIISISDDKTISVPNGQSLFLMGCIAMSGAGSATASNTAYTTTTDKTYSYGNNQMVRHADYKNIGTTDSTDSDYVLATSDEYLNTKVNVPYIISKYTSETNGNYPARTLTTDTFSINLEENGTYTLPDGFRGIGSLEKNSDNLQMKISRFDGKNCTVNLNMSYYTYEIGKDSTIKYDVYTDNTGKYGLGLFNSLINNSNNSTIIISNLNISGNVISEIYKNENGDKAYGGNNYKDYKMLPVSGIIGGYKPDTKGNVTITNVNISGLDLKSNYIAGGLIGYVNGNGKEGTLSINNCQSNGSGISATVGHYVGGMVGYVENNITVNIGDETNKSEFIINKINSIGDYASSNKWHDTFSAGGLIGYAYNNCTYNVKFMEVTGDTIESFGVCGGIVGRAMNGQTATIDNCVVKGIDLYGSFVGGITGITRITTEIKNCKVIGDTNKNKMIAYNSAGGIFSFSMEKDCKIDNCLVENYIIKLTGEKSIAYPENVGGFVGKIQYKNYKLTINNSKISDCNIQNQDCLVYKSGDDAGTGGVIGHCESGMKLYGYNILLNNVSLTDESGNELTSKAGYIAGRNEDVINLVGFCINGVTFNKDFGTKSLTASAYVIYSDYDRTNKRI